jgi:hypothetical protein
MLEALKASNEPEHLVQAATRYLKGLKGNLVQIKKQKQLKAHAARESAATSNFQQYQQQQQMGYGQPLASMPPPVFRKPGGNNAPPSGPGFYTTSGWMA